MAFMACPVLPQREMSIREFKAWLKQYDADRDGSISREELQQALRSLHTWFAWWKARDGVKRADLDRNGKVDKLEMDRLVSFAQQHLQMKIYAND